MLRDALLAARKLSMVNDSSESGGSSEGTMI